MSKPDEDDETPRHAEKSTMQEPQEEFIADQSVPSTDQPPKPPPGPPSREKQ